MQVLQSFDPQPLSKNLDVESPEIRSESSEIASESVAAAIRVQKVYRSYRTRRRLADSAVIIEELWWQVLDFARLSQSTISFFNFSKPESAASRWNRVTLNASKVGQGLSKDSKALKLAFQHWIEASIWAYSGHYKPSEENLNNFLTFVRENGVGLNEVQVRSSSNEDYYDDPKEDQGDNTIESTLFREPPLLELPMEIEKIEKTLSVEQTVISKTELSILEDKEAKGSYKRTLSGGLQSPRADVPRKAILERIKSKREARSYQLGNQLSLKWSTGVGPRIGCAADYPMELRMQALEIMNLSPQSGQPVNFSPWLPPTPHSSGYLASCLLPTCVGKI